MYLDLLKEIMPPPEQPVCNGSNELFDETESRLKLTLPDDYRRFIMTYGEGKICNEWCIYSPFSEGEYDIFNLFKKIEDMDYSYMYLKNADEERRGFSSRAEYAGSCYNYSPPPGELTMYGGRKYSGDGYPFDFYPSPEGLFPFGCDFSGYEFYWKMSKNKKWSIVVYPDMSCFLEYDMSLTEFIYKILTCQTDCDGLSDITGDGVFFQQFIHSS